MTSVYLAGPMMGRTFEEAVHWRIEAHGLLANHGLEAVDPLIEEVLSGDLTGYYQRDVALLKSCDAVLANLPDRRSVGTIGEITLAHEWDMPIAAFGPDEVREHEFINEIVRWWVWTPQEAVMLLAEWRNESTVLGTASDPVPRQWPPKAH